MSVEISLFVLRYVHTGPKFPSLLRLKFYIGIPRISPVGNANVVR